MAELAIDLGWDMGWCLDRHGNYTSGVEPFRTIKGDGLRLLAMTDFLTTKLTVLQRTGETVTAVYYEQINFVGKNDAHTMHAHGKQLGGLERWCALKKLPAPVGILWDRAKKHVSGHRSAARETIRDLVAKSFPEVTDHNQASAVAVMLCAQNKKLPQPEASPRAAQIRRGAGG